jgi:Copper type II ascorbate-dependent monooxygenase, C-terminal domain
MVVAAKTTSRAVLPFGAPPHAANWESPPMEAEFLADAELVSMFPHMHMRGKDMSYQLIFPNGETETLLKVPRYDFNWQMGYDVAQPIKIPKGTRILVTAHFDNSANNKFNPDPEQTVYYGDMTWEEMMTPFFSVTVAPGGRASAVSVSPMAASTSARWPWAGA